MANTDQIFGLRPVRTLSGGEYTGQGIMCYKAAGTTDTHDLYLGDPVIPDGSADANGVIRVVKSTMGDGNPIMGIIQGIKNDPDNKGRATWIDGADAGYVYVCVDPCVIYEAQADAAVAITAIGENAVLIQTTANASNTSGYSGVEVDATVASTATYQVKVIGIVQREDNTVNSANNKVLVTINNRWFGGATGTEGL